MNLSRCRRSGGDNRTVGEICATRKYAAAALSGEEVDGNAVVPLLVPQPAYDQLRRRPGCERQHGPVGPRELAGGASRFRSALRKLHLRDQQRSAGASFRSHFQRV